jgi:hypothetical protein
MMLIDSSSFPSDYKHIKSSPVHIAPACAGSGEGPNHFGSYVYQSNNITNRYNDCQLIYHYDRCPDCRTKEVLFIPRLGTGFDYHSY